jgi:hypothetical protein
VPLLHLNRLGTRALRARCNGNYNCSAAQTNKSL